MTNDQSGSLEDVDQRSHGVGFAAASDAEESLITKTFFDRVG